MPAKNILDLFSYPVFKLIIAAINVVRNKNVLRQINSNILSSSFADNIALRNEFSANIFAANAIYSNDCKSVFSGVAISTQ